METLVTIARSAAMRWPESEALRFDLTGEGLSFAEFDRRTDRIAAGLVAAGVAPGDRVAVCSANTALFPLAWFGTMKAGAIMVPLNVGYRLDDARHVFELTEPKAVFCDEARTGLVGNLLSTTPSLRLLVTDAAAAPAGWEALDAFEQKRTRVVLPAIQPSDLTNIQFTSGTSGLPKGCMLSHEYWIELARSIDANVLSLAPGETMITAQAFSYLDPQWAFALTLIKGARLAVLERFRPTELWEKIVHYEARFFYCLAAMPLMLLSLPPSEAERKHRLRTIMCSAIPADRHRELENRFVVPWIEGYGATETGSDLGVSWTDHAHSVGTGTIGRALPHREATIVDSLFSEVADGEVGELLVRGRAMMAGYWRNPEATSSVFHDGWYRTGDLARRDADGLFYLAGRSKDMIRRAGENIAASEVEGVLQKYPGVILAACVAVPDPIRGEEIKVFVVRSGDVPLKQLVGYLEVRLARFKIPRYWQFVESLPMTPSERVAKPRLSREIGTGVVDLQALTHARVG